jgi:hypothetical protein
MKQNAGADATIDAFLRTLHPREATVEGVASGLAVRALATEDLAWISGGLIVDDGAGGTELQSQGTTDRCKNDG